MRSDEHAPAACTALAVTAVPGGAGRGNTTLALRGDGDPPGRTRGNRAVPAACLAVDGHPAPASRGPRTHSPHRARPMSLLPEYSLQFTTLVEYSQRWYRFARSKQPQQPAVTGTGQTRGHTSASPRCWPSASPRENSYPVMQRPRSPACARTTAWPARPRHMHCMCFRMPGSCTGSPDSATTSALTSFPGFADPGGQLRDREPGSEETLPPGTALCPLLSARGGCRPECITW